MILLFFPEFQTGVVLPSDDKHKTNKKVAMAMDFEAKHRECVRVLTYTNHDHVKVKLFVFYGKSGIPETLKAAAQYIFKEMDFKLEWLDLYRDVDEILKIRPLKYPSGTQQVLEDSQVDEINKTIYENLHVLVRHRNITAVQPSLKITNSKQTGIPCITLYVLCKGIIPDGECPFPLTLGSYPVDVVDGIWFRTDDVWEPNKAQEQSEVLCLGASIGVQGEDAAGTLGAIVKDDETFYVLSCDHVMRHGTKEEIIHPAMNDYLNYLKHHLKGYGWTITNIIKNKSRNISANEYPLGPNLGWEQLSKEFQRLKEIRKDHQRKETIAEKNSQVLNQREKDFERGLNRPRVIAKYSFGISCNVNWKDGKKYYIDAALAELTPEEVNSLRQSQKAEMIGTGHRPSENCSSRINPEPKLCKSGRTTAFTECGTHIKPMSLSVSLHEVDKRTFDVLKRVRLCQSCKKRSEIKEQIESIEAPCDSCEKDEAALKDSLWLNNCLCIGYKYAIGEKKPFVALGDSGAVLFEEGKQGDPLQAYGIIFAEHQNAYQSCALASPMDIVLESLSREGTPLKLVSKFE